MNPVRLTPRVNPKLKVTISDPFVIVDDFLENIDEFREQLLHHGEFSHARKNSVVPDVGPVHDWRQIIRNDELPEEFRFSIAELKKYDPRRLSHYCANLLYSDMKISTKKVRASYYPHLDVRTSDGGAPIVFNLWLHDGGGGTAFYEYDGYKSGSEMPKELKYFAEHFFDESEPEYVPGQNFQTFNCNFQESGPWRMWHLAAMKKNRAFIYSGDLWHRAYIPKGEYQYPNPRYSFVAFTAERL